MKQELSSGATIEVTPASFMTSWKLLSAVLFAFKMQGINLKMGERISAEKLMEDNLSGLLGALIDIVASEHVLDLAFECAKSCVYTKNGVMQKISKDTFEEENNRADFIEAMYVVVKENLLPFFPKALTKSLETLGQTTNTVSES